MNEIRIQFLYGTEFWEKLEELTRNAQERVIFASAYINKETVRRFRELIPDEVYHLLICKNIEYNQNIPNGNVLLINDDHFHGKVYLIDNVIIFGSQNLLDARIRREGEFNVMFTLQKDDASALFYQCMLKMTEQVHTPSEPVNDLFFDLYNNGECPFCGNMITDPSEVRICSGYSNENGNGFVSIADCESYNNEGACQWCDRESLEVIEGAYCCDDSGCGLGINSSDNRLIHHGINELRGEKRTKAFEFLRLFNFIARKINGQALTFFEALDLKEKVYDTPITRPEIELLIPD